MTRHAGRCSERVLTLPQVADLFGVRPITVRKWVQRGALRARKAGPAWIVDPEDLALLPRSYYRR